VLKVLAVTVVVCAVVAAGCGGSKKKSASPTTSSTSAATTSTSSGTPKFATSKNCAQLESLGTKLAQALQTTSGSVETRLTKEAQLLHDYANAAPSDVTISFR